MNYVRVMVKVSARNCGLRPVFHAMFCGPLAEKGEVTIPDIEPAVFREFLRYIYTDTTDITADNVSGLLYTSRKYAVDALLNKCTHYLENCLTENNVCQILEQCHGYGEVDLEQKALRILTQAGETVIKSSGFLDLCSNCFGYFLKSDQLRMTEEQLFEATLSWTKHACQKENVPVTHENLRKFLREMVYEIRFTSMSLDYLVNVVGQSGVLSDSERLRIMDKHLRPSSDISQFKAGPRKKVQSTQSEICFVHRFQGNASFNMSNLNVISLYPRTHVISLSATTNVALIGCQLFGPYKNSTSQLIRITVTNTDTHVTLQAFENTVPLKGNAQLNDITFPEPVVLNAGCTYTLCVTISHIYTWCGTKGQQSVEVNGVTFAFKESSQITGETTVSKGQIPGLIFKQL